MVLYIGVYEEGQAGPMKLLNKKEKKRKDKKKRLSDAIEKKNEGKKERSRGDFL